MTAMTEQKIQGWCPQGCGQTLGLDFIGRVLCTNGSCPDHRSVHKILDNDVSEHVVELERKTFSIKHPLRERVDDDLFTCELHQMIKELDGPPQPPGRYTVHEEAGHLHWQRLS